MFEFFRLAALAALFTVFLSAAAWAEDLVSVRVASEPAGARIYVNGIERGQTPATLQLPTGKNEIFVYKEGYLPVRRSVEWLPGERPTYKEMLRRQSRGLVVIADPPGARVFLDQRPLGHAPLAVENVQPGFYQVEVRRDGFKTFAATLELPAERPRVLNILLEGPPVSIFVEGEAGARVYLDGSYAGEITQDSLVVKARAGSHELRIERNGFASVQHLQLEPGRDVVVGMGTLKRMPAARGDEVVKVNPRWYLVAASFGVGAAGAGLAGVAYVEAHDARKTYEKAWRRSEIASAKDRIERNNLLFAVGTGIFAAGAAGGWFAWPGTEQKVTMTLLPQALLLHARLP